MEISLSRLKFIVETCEYGLEEFPENDSLLFEVINHNYDGCPKETLLIKVKE